MILVPRLCCPRCGRVHLASSYRQGDAIHECVRMENRRCCGQHWWSMVIEEGDVEPQLAWAFESPAIAAFAIDQWRLPATVPDVRYWQVPLTGNQVHHHRFSAPAVLFEALYKVVGLARPRRDDSAAKSGGAA